MPFEFTSYTIYYAGKFFWTIINDECVDNSEKDDILSIGLAVANQNL